MADKQSSLNTGESAPAWRKLLDTLDGLFAPIVYAIGKIANPSANFTRPNDTTAYASGDLVANNVTAGSVVPLSFTAARVALGNFAIRRAKLKKSGIVATNAQFRLHLYSTTPTPPTNGDNGAWVSPEAGYLGSFDFTLKAFTDACAEVAASNQGNEINVVLASGQIIYGLLEARAAYTPIANEVFTTSLEIRQN